MPASPHGRSDSRPRPRPTELAQGLGLLGLALLLYGFDLNREFVFDDIPYIRDNAMLRQPGAFALFWTSGEAFNFYPLFWSLLRIQWLLWGEQPLGYHAVNLVLHTLNALLVWRIARTWNLPGAWWVGALFAVHPVNVQTVAWAAEQKNTWAFLFLGLSLLAFLRHLQKGSATPYLLSLLAFLASLACKTATVGLPVFLALYLAVQGRATLRRFGLRLIPFFVAALAAGVTTLWFERHRVGAASLVGQLDLWQRIEAAAAAFWFYLAKALVPAGLTPFYRGWNDTTAAAHGPLPAALCALVLVAGIAARRRIPAPALLGLLFYAVMLMPMLGLFDTNYFRYSIIADHWQYFALPGLLVALVTPLAGLAHRQPKFLPGAGLAGLLLLACFSALTARHLARFEDARALWSHTVTRNPESWLGWYNLGIAHFDRREPDAAISAYRNALRHKPHYPQALFNLGNAFLATGRFEEAARAFLAVQSLEPQDATAYTNRGGALLHLGRDAEARTEFERALAIDPHSGPAHINLLILALRHGEIATATRHLEAIGVPDPANAARIRTAIESAQADPNIAGPMLSDFVTRARRLGTAPPTPNPPPAPTPPISRKQGSP